MDVGRQNVEDPMHQIANTAKAIYFLALNIRAGEFTPKKRNAEVILERFPELAEFTMTEEKKDGYDTSHGH